MHNYKTTGVCSSNIQFDIKNNKIENTSFDGGCNGNLKGISNLINGTDIDIAIEKLSGIKCGNKSSSCPDQLAEALKIWKSKNI